MKLAWSRLLLRQAVGRLAFTLTCLTLGYLLSACNFKEMRQFFQARPVDLNTDISVETTPKLSPALNGEVLLDGKKVADKTPYVAKHVIPGPHALKVSARGYIGQEMEVDAKEGEVTQLSLALQPLPHVDATGAIVQPGHEATVHAVHKGKEANPVVAVSSDFASHFILLTASPPLSVQVDGKDAGNSTGLRLELGKSQGQIRLGTLNVTYWNRPTHVTLQPSVGANTIRVDGEALAAQKPKLLELDTRPRRIEVTDAAGGHQIILLKLVN